MVGKYFTDAKYEIDFKRPAGIQTCAKIILSRLS